VGSETEARPTRRGRRLPVVALVSYVVALLAWVALFGHVLPMPGQGSGMQMSDPGVPEAMATSNGALGVALYLLMWGTMMVAMMYPTSVPLFRLYAGTLTDAGTAKTVAGLGAFVGTYTVAWTLTGIVPLAVETVVPLARLDGTGRGLLVGGALLVLAGYQLSPYKDRCLRRCRSPLGFLLEHYRPGVRGAVRTSWRFSVFCIGCCWALFAFMVVVGSMNLLWMAAIAVVLSLERAVSWGSLLARGVGVVAGVVGVAVVVATLLA